MYVSLKSKTHMHALRTVLIQSHDELTHTCFSSVVVSWCGCGGVVVCPKTRRVFDGIEEGRATYTITVIVSMGSLYYSVLLY
jgi:hypothetical protein